MRFETDYIEEAWYVPQTNKIYVFFFQGSRLMRVSFDNKAIQWTPKFANYLHLSLGPL